LEYEKAGATMKEMQELIEAAEEAYRSMAGNNSPFDPEVWSKSVLRLEWAIAAARASEGGWIDCKFGFPADYADVLCWDGTQIHRSRYRSDSVGYRWDCDTYGLQESEVTYWRLLPSPPLSVEKPKEGK